MSDKINMLKGFIMGTFNPYLWSKKGLVEDWIALWENNTTTKEDKIKSINEYLKLAGLDTNEYFLTHCKNWEDEISDSIDINLMESWKTKLNDY